jgi:gas vesicle protein
MDEKTIVIKQGSFGSFLRGAIIGAAVALLLAPRSGRETRDLLTEKGSEFKDKAMDMAKETRQRAEGAFSNTRMMIEETFKNAKDASTETKKDMKRELEIMEDINNPHFPL